MRAVEYSTRPLTLQELIWVQQAQQRMDAVAMLAIIEARTDLSRDEALGLDQNEVGEVFAGIADGINRSAALAKLQEQLAPEADA